MPASRKVTAMFCPDVVPLVGPNVTSQPAVSVKVYVRLPDPPLAEVLIIADVCVELRAAVTELIAGAWLVVLRWARVATTLGTPQPQPTTLPAEWRATVPVWPESGRPGADW